MEIKEEGASEEGQHFLPTPQANDTGDFQLTSKYVSDPPWNSLTMQIGSPKHTHACGFTATWVLPNGMSLTKFSPLYYLFWCCESMICLFCFG